MTEFKMQISGIGSDRSTNCATTTAHSRPILLRFILFNTVYSK